MSKTPVGISIAKWTAVAAGITALGSVFQTVWTERPWWLAKDEPAPVVASAQPPSAASDGFVKMRKEPEMAVRSARAPASEPVVAPAEAMTAISVEPPTASHEVAMSSAPERGWSIWRWMVIFSVVVFIIAKVVERVLHRRHQASQSE